MKEHLKARLPEDVQARVRRLSRLRWLTKARIFRGAGYSVTRDPGMAARFILLDPEVESYSYDLDNEGELVAWAVEALDVEPAQVAAWISETKDDPELTTELARRLRWRFDVKTSPGLALRLVWHVLVRACKPALVVECGVLSGLGSLVLLRALERNAAEGEPGRLLSFDIREEAGWIVPSHLRGNWTRRIESSLDGLRPALVGQEIGMLFHDTPHTEEFQRAEFGAALDHAAARLVLVDGSGGRVGVLKDLARDRGGSYRHFKDRPRDHFYRSPGVGVAFFERAPGPD